MLSFMHLTVFEALFRLRSVTLAAQALDVPQPTLSRHLQILREHFNDKLFVRTRAGMEPTAIAQSASSAVADALSLYRTRLSGEAHFDPALSHRNFHIAASDVGHLLVLPPLERETARLAPRIRLTAVPLGRSRLIAQLEAGEVDVAIGSFPNLFAGVREQTLFREEYVCIVPLGIAKAGHLSLDRFKAARHIIVDGHHLGHVHQEVERQIMALVGDDNVRILSENFLLSALLAERTDLILTVPSRVARVLTRARTVLCEPPLHLPGFDVKQYWHERFDQDPGNSWLRGKISGARRVMDGARPHATLAQSAK